MLQALILSLVLFQTRVNQEKQTFGSNLMVNDLYYKATFMDNGKYQLLPGHFFNSMLKVKPFTPPPNSQTICGRTPDGNSHPAYEFASVGDVILGESEMFICTPLRRWRKIALQSF